MSYTIGRITMAVSLLLLYQLSIGKKNFCVKNLREQLVHV
jgi:hypothetical protein